MEITGRSDRNAVVIGAGLGGLAAAIRLASAGWQVQLFERQTTPGGKAGSEERDGYRFDTGPSLLTMVDVIEDLFATAGKDWRDYIAVRRLDVICNYFWSDGTTLSAPGDPARLAAEIERSLGEPRENVLRYFEHAGRIDAVATDLFLRHSLHDLRTYLSLDFLRRLFRVGRIDALRSLNRSHERFFTRPKVVQLFNRYATYNGSDPYRTPATMAIIPYIEYTGGGFAVEGGIHALPRALERLARELGVEISLDAAVESIEVDDSGRRRVTGVTVDGNRIAAPVVVSNVDVSVTYPELLGDTRARQLRRYHRLEPSSSGLVFYWGMNRTFDALTTNNIFFSDDYPAEFTAIFGERRCPDEPTIYVNITSRVTPSDAPPGGENWFVLINAPAVSGQDWGTETARVRRNVIARLSRLLGSDIGGAIATEGVMTPPQIEEKTNSFRGALYGIASNTPGAAFSRHPNRSRTCRGLYFCGGSAHPGGGMPLVMLSGAIAADLAIRDSR